VHVGGTTVPGRRQHEHGAQLLAPGKGPYVPAGQGVQVVLVEAPMAFDHVPAGQGVEFTEESGQ